MTKTLRKAIVWSILVSFWGSSIQMPSYAQIDPLPFMPVAGTMVPLSLPFVPAYLKGIVIHPKDPFKFDFIIYKGDKPLTYDQKKQEYAKLTKYFLASLAIPDEDQWVNLSPYEKDRIIKDNFGKTEMGRDLLAQDYLLKQITASLIYPESQLGQKFWKKAYAQAQKQFGTTDIPVNTFNKVWILPDDALIYEKGNAAYVLKNHLRVMLEEDYLALQKRGHINVSPLSNNHKIASEIIRQIVLPELQKEVNEGANFAPLRQVYSGMLLATWFKRTLKQSVLGQIYANKAKVKGVDQDLKTNEAIYQQYLKAYKKGVFNFIKEDADSLTNERIPRKYFSGGDVSYAMAPAALNGRDPIQITYDNAMGISVAEKDKAYDDMAEIGLVTDKAGEVMEELRNFNLPFDAYKYIRNQNAENLKYLILNSDNSYDIYTAILRLVANFGLESLDELEGKSINGQVRYIHDFKSLNEDLDKTLEAFGQVPYGIDIEHNFVRLLEIILVSRSYALMNQFQKKIFPRFKKLNPPLISTLPLFDDWLAYATIDGPQYEAMVETLGELAGHPAASAQVFAENAAHLQLTYQVWHTEDIDAQTCLINGFLPYLHEQLALMKKLEAGTPQFKRARNEARAYAGALLHGLLPKGIRSEEDLLKKLAQGLEAQGNSPEMLYEAIRDSWQFFLPEIPRYLYFAKDGHGPSEVRLLAYWNAKNRTQITFRQLVWGDSSRAVERYRQKMQPKTKDDKGKLLPVFRLIERRYRWLREDSPYTRDTSAVVKYQGLRADRAKSPAMTARSVKALGFMAAAAFVLNVAVHLGSKLITGKASNTRDIINTGIVSVVAVVGVYLLQRFTLQLPLVNQQAPMTAQVVQKTINQFFIDKKIPTQITEVGLVDQGGASLQVLRNSLKLWINEYPSKREIIALLADLFRDLDRVAPDPNRPWTMSKEMSTELEGRLEKALKVNGIEVFDDGDRAMKVDTADVSEWIHPDMFAFLRKAAGVFIQYQGGGQEFSFVDGLGAISYTFILADHKTVIQRWDKLGALIDAESKNGNAIPEAMMAFKALHPGAEIERTVQGVSENIEERTKDAAMGIEELDRTKVAEFLGRYKDRLGAGFESMLKKFADDGTGTMAELILFETDSSLINLIGPPMAASVKKILAENDFYLDGDDQQTLSLEDRQIWYLVRMVEAANKEFDTFRVQTPLQLKDKQAGDYSNDLAGVYAIWQKTLKDKSSMYTWKKEDIQAFENIHHSLVAMIFKYPFLRHVEAFDNLSSSLWRPVTQLRHMFLGDAAMQEQTLSLHEAISIIQDLYTPTTINQFFKIKNTKYRVESFDSKVRLIAPFWIAHFAQEIKRSGLETNIFIQRLHDKVLPEDMVERLYLPSRQEGLIADAVDLNSFSQALFSKYLEQYIAKILKAGSPKRLKILLGGTGFGEIKSVLSVLDETLRRSSHLTKEEDIEAWISRWDIQVVAYSIETDSLLDIDSKMKAEDDKRYHQWVRMEYIDLLDDVDQERIKAEKPDVIFSVSSLYFHHYLRDQDKGDGMRRYLQLVGATLKPGGLFVGDDDDSYSVPQMVEFNPPWQHFPLGSGFFIKAKSLDYANDSLDWNAEMVGYPGKNMILYLDQLYKRHSPDGYNNLNNYVKSLPAEEQQGYNNTVKEDMKREVDDKWAEFLQKLVQSFSRFVPKPLLIDHLIRERKLLGSGTRYNSITTDKLLQLVEKLNPALPSEVTSLGVNVQQFLREAQSDDFLKVFRKEYRSSLNFIFRHRNDAAMKGAEAKDEAMISRLGRDLHDLFHAVLEYSDPSRYPDSTPEQMSDYVKDKFLEPRVDGYLRSVLKILNKDIGADNKKSELEKLQMSTDSNEGQFDTKMNEMLTKADSLKRSLKRPLGMQDLMSIEGSLKISELAVSILEWAQDSEFPEDDYPIDIEDPLVVHQLQQWVARVLRDLAYYHQRKLIEAYPDLGQLLKEKSFLQMALTNFMLAPSDLTLRAQLIKALGDDDNPESIKGHVLDIVAKIHELRDKAMNVDHVMPGGIDMNSANLNLRIKRDGTGMPLPFSQQDLAQFGDFAGLDPVILSIQPASQSPLFAELVAH